MGTDELHEHAPERKRNMDDQPVFVAAEIKDTAKQYCPSSSSLARRSWYSLIEPFVDDPMTDATPNPEFHDRTTRHRLTSPLRAKAAR
jgi:hypothetical protein